MSRQRRAARGAHYAINALNKIDLRAAQHVLVHGASGAVGAAAAQLLKARDVQVTATCTALTNGAGADAGCVPRH